MQRPSERMEHIGGPLRRASVSRVPVTTPDGVMTYAEPEPCPICWQREVNHVRCQRCGCKRILLTHRYDGREKQEIVDCPDCSDGQLKRQRTEKLIPESGLSRRRDIVFSNYTPLPGQEDGWQAVRQFVSAPEGWLFLYGAPGTGKTTMATCAGNAWLNRAMAVVFGVVPDLLDQLRATFHPDSDVSYDARFTALMDAELLILDDYGRQKSTQWAEEKLFQLLNHRWLDRLSTIITTNLRLEDLDPAIYSRVNDERVCRVVRVTGEDQRRPAGRLREGER